LCAAKILLFPFRSDGNLEVLEMITRKAKFLSAAAAVLALVATVSVARTLHTHAVPTDQTHVTTGKVIGTAPTQTTTPAPRRGIIVCGMALDSDCEKIETLLPM
jgi:hypothetical protein